MTGNVGVPVQKAKKVAHVAPVKGPGKSTGKGKGTWKGKGKGVMVIPANEAEDAAFDRDYAEVTKTYQARLDDAIEESCLDAEQNPLASFAFDDHLDQKCFDMFEDIVCVHLLAKNQDNKRHRCKFFDKNFPERCGPVHCKFNGCKTHCVACSLYNNNKPVSMCEWHHEEHVTRVRRLAFGSALTHFKYN
jgi:hypothetical protein